MSDKSKNDYLVQGSVLAIAGLLTRMIGMIYRIPLNRIVGEEGMGYYANAYEIYNLALIISTYSVPVAVSKLVSVKDDQREFHNSYLIFKVALAISGTLGLVVSALVFFFNRELSAAMGWPSAAFPLKFLAPTIFVFSIMGVIRGFFQGKKTMVPTSISQIIEQIFNAAGSVIAALLFINACADTTLRAQYGAAGGATGTLIGAIFGLLFLIVIFSLNSGFFRHKEAGDLTGLTDSYSTIAKSVLLTMLPIVLSQTIYQLSGFIDSYMFAHIMDAKGYTESARSIMYDAYSNKYRWLCNLPVAIASAFGVSIVPVLSSHYNQGDIDECKRKVEASVKLNMIIAIPSAVGIIALGGPIIVMLFNNSNSQLTDNLMILGGVSVVFFALSTYTNGVLQGLNHLHLPVIHSAISLVVHIGINYLFIGYLDFGIYGLTIGNVTYALLICILNWFSIDRILGYEQEVWTSFIVPFASAAVMGVSALAIYTGLYRLTHHNTPSVLIAMIWAICIYFVLLIRFKGISEEEINGMPRGRSIVKLLKKVRLLK